MLYQPEVCAASIQWIIDSGSGFDLISSFAAEEKGRIEPAKNHVSMATANGITTANTEWTGYVPGLQKNISASVLDNSPCNVLSLGKMCMEKGY